MDHGFSINVEEPSWERKVIGLFDLREALTMRAPTAFSIGEQVCSFTYLCFNKSHIHIKKYVGTKPLFMS